jgi:CelD/BcsL family acetyltransferase involved in cellulose biosynthesis
MLAIAKDHRNGTEVQWQIFPATELARQREIWDTLKRQMADLPILDAEFFELLLKHFGSGRERLAVAMAGKQPVAAGIFQPNGPWSWCTFQPSQAPLGAWLASGAVTATIAQTLAPRLAPLCVFVGITQQDPDLVPRPSSVMLEGVDYIRTARVTITGTFEDYWSKRGKNLRHTLRRQRNRLERESVVTRLRIVTHPDEVANAVAHYGQLESRGWKAQFGTAIAPDNAQGRLYAEWLKSCATRGETAIFEYYFGDIFVASDLCVHRHGVLLILKTTYDESQDTTSPTMLMRREMFEAFHHEGRISRVEFYGSLMGWHTKWTEEIRQMYHVNVFRWPSVRHVRALSKRAVLHLRCHGETANERTAEPEAAEV